MSTNKPVKAGHLLASLYRCVKDSMGLDSIPGLLNQILTEGLWKEVYIEDFGEIVTYDKFNDFVTTAPPHGLGSSIDTLEKLCSGHKNILQLITDAKNQGPGNLDFGLDKHKGTNTQRPNIDNVHIRPLRVKQKETGNSQTAGLRRIKSEINKAKSPERREKIKALQQQVFNNEISVHKALIIIGARRETFTIPVEPKSAARSIKKRFAPDQIAQLITLLQD